MVEHPSMSLKKQPKKLTRNGRFSAVKESIHKADNAIEKARKSSHIKGLRAFKGGAGGGVEPARVISPTDFESASSANSNTPADIV